MNILFKYLLLKTVILNICANTYSMEDLSSFISNYSIVDYSYNITDSSNSNNNNTDNIYHPNILNFIQNKSKERVEIINGQQYIHLTLEEICKYTNTDNKYKNIKSKINSFHSTLNWILNKIKLLEVELKKDKLKYKSDINYVEKYINNSLQDTINYQKELIVFLKNIKEQLNTLYNITSETNVEENINEYIKIANKLLVYNNIKQPSYEYYLDIFNNTIEKYNKDAKYLIKEFKDAHSNLIKRIDKNLNSIIKKTKSITNIIINNMQENKYFIFIIDKYKCRSNFLINELNNMINNDSNTCDNMCYTYSINKEHNNLCRENVLLHLEHYKKKLITDQVIKIQELFKKKLLFNSTNTKIIAEAQNIIEEIKQKLKVYNI